MKCAKCGVELVENAVYCHMCGKKQVQGQRKALKRANGTGTVYKLNGRRRKPWVACKSGVIVGYYETRTGALEAINKLTGKDINEKFNMTFEEVYKEWIAEHSQSIDRSSIRSYELSYKSFSALHNKKFRDLRTQDFQAVVDQNSHKSHSTVAKLKNLVTQMSKWAMREEVSTTNFAAFVRLPEKVKKEKEVFTDKDIEKLKKDNSETAKIILMLIYTGMRIGELFSLPLKNCHATYVVGGEKTAAGKNRTIPIMKEAREYFKYFAEHATGELLLSGYVGDKTVDNFRKRYYYPLLEKLKIPKKTPHATRHTYISVAVRAGMKPEYLQKVVGHSDYSTTANEYNHVDQKTLIKAVEQISVANKSLTNKKNQKKKKTPETA